MLETLSLIYPDHPDFWTILHGNFPPNWQNNIPSDWDGAVVVDWNTWLLKLVGKKDEEEYLWGGEFDAFDEIKYWYEDNGCSY